MNEFEIYFRDLTPEAQKAFLAYMEMVTPEEGNYDVFPIAVVENYEEEPELPHEAVVELSELDCSLNDEEEIKDAVVDFLTDEFGFCINGCDISLEDEGLAKVTNIDWDTEE